MIITIASVSIPNIVKSLFDAYFQSSVYSSKFSLGVRSNAKRFLKGKDDLTEMISEDSACAGNTWVTFRRSICIQFVPPFLRLSPMENRSFLPLSLRLKRDIDSVYSEKIPLARALILATHFYRGCAGTPVFCE